MKLPKNILIDGQCKKNSFVTHGGNLCNIQFWNNNTAIENYTRTILDHLGIEKEVSVSITHSKTDVAYDGEIIKIQLPYLFSLTKENKLKNIYVRGVMLRHELSHIFMGYNYNGCFAALINQ